MNEIWKEINGYEGYFEVSNLGNFRSKDRIIKYKNNGLRKYPSKALKIEQMADGYCRIVLMKDSIKRRYMCHRLVAEAFIENQENKPFVNHMNGIRNDNRAENLEWCTQSENERHSIDILGKTMKNKTFPRKVKCLNNNRDFNSMSEAIRFIGKGCIEGLHKSIDANRNYHGYKFIYN